MKKLVGIITCTLCMFTSHAQTQVTFAIGKRGYNASLAALTLGTSAAAWRKGSPEGAGIALLVGIASMAHAPDKQWRLSMSQPVYDLSSTAVSLLFGAIAASRCNPATIHDFVSHRSKTRQDVMEQVQAQISVPNWMANTIAATAERLQVDYMLIHSPIPYSSAYNLIRAGVGVATALGSKLCFILLPYPAAYRSYKPTPDAWTKWTSKKVLSLIAGSIAYRFTQSHINPQDVHTFLHHAPHMAAPQAAPTSWQSRLGITRMRNLWASLKTEGTYAQKCHLNPNYQDKLRLFASGLAGVATGYATNKLLDIAVPS